VAVEEQQRLQRLVLRGGTDLAVHRQMRQELLDLGRAELTGVPTVVKQDVTPQPLQVGLLCSQGEVPGAHLLARHREQARLVSHVV
jgi:hypothetical protein